MNSHVSPLVPCGTDLCPLQNVKTRNYRLDTLLLFAKDTGDNPVKVALSSQRE